MATYIILSKFSAQAFTDPGDFKGLADTVAAKQNDLLPGRKPESRSKIF